jgi:hypothetical protein
MLAAAEHGAVVPLGPPTPAGPAFPAQSSGPWHQPQYPAYQHADSASRPVPALASRRVGPAVFSLAVVALIVAVGFLLIPKLGASEDQASPKTGTQDTRAATTPDIDGSADPPATAASTAASGAPPSDLLTPAGARTVVTALTDVMGGSKVSDLTLFPDRASATAPAPAVKNGFDDFTYSDGAATRDGPDQVDPDRAVLDLNEVNWDALPALWDRAEKELGVDKPTMRYIIVDTDIIDGTASLRLYLSDDYGGAYLLATIAGDVVRLYARDS